MVGGIYAGNAFSRRSATARDAARLDEYIGLGEHTAMTGELDLQVGSTTITTSSGKPAKVMLTLTNKTSRPMALNSWLAPAPETFQSNQLPIKVRITRNGKPVRFVGNSLLYPPHTKKDFFVLKPGKSKRFAVDVSRGPKEGAWDMAKPGAYTAEIWYETYLTGRYIGVHAWTGMTNHVIVKVAVR